MERRWFLAPSTGVRFSHLELVNFRPPNAQLGYATEDEISTRPSGLTGIKLQADFATCSLLGWLRTCNAARRFDSDEWL